MEREILLYLANSVRPVRMAIYVPTDRDPEEYIDEFLEGMLNEFLRYNCEWEFAEAVQ